MFSQRRNTHTVLKMLCRRHLQPIRQAVTIRDLIVTQDQEHANPGDFFSKDRQTETNQELVQRNLSHIKELAEQAIIMHLADNFSLTENDYEMRLDCLDHITRLTTNEFYFYPSKYRGRSLDTQSGCVTYQGLLNEDSFGELIAGIEALAAGYPENCHLTLASFPLQDKNNRQHNMVIHVQCGKNPVINTFAKAIPANEDPEYFGVIEHKSRTSMSESSSTSENIFLAALGNNDNGISGITYSTPIHCTTFGGAQFLTTIDICMDHQYGLAKLALAAELQQTLSMRQTAMVEQVTHIVTSNRISIYESNLTSRIAVHADPKQPALHTLDDEAIEAVHVKKSSASSFSSRSYTLRYYPQRDIEKTHTPQLKTMQRYNDQLPQVLALSLFVKNNHPTLKIVNEPAREPVFSPS